MSIKRNVFTVNKVYDLIVSQLIEFEPFDEVEGSLWAWGLGANGRLGDNSVCCRSSPVQIPGTQWTRISSGDLHTLAVKTDGTLWTWGTNCFGEGGQNNLCEAGLPGRPRYSSPRQIPGTQWNDVAAGGFRSFGRKTDGTLWGWGNNSCGSLGIDCVTPTTFNISSPRQIPGTNWVDIVTGCCNSMARKTDGTLWSWGVNCVCATARTGTLGDGTVINRCSPVQVPGTQWNDISLTICRYATAFARKTDGTLWGWGMGTTGILGNNCTICFSSPIQILGNQWSDISLKSGFSHTLAVKTDGTLWGWGAATCGALGDGTIISKSSPVQVPGTQWNEVFAGNQQSLARKKDLSLWTWGLNTQGQLGDETVIPKSSPVQIPGNQWITISAGFCQSFAKKQN